MRRMKEIYSLFFLLVGIMSVIYFLNYTNVKPVTKEEPKREAVKQNDYLYEPLNGTSNSWTMLDIRRRFIGPNIPYGVNNGNFETDLTVKSVIESTSVNRTFNSNILIYNRVPKCGSTTMKQFLVKMSQRNKFKYEHSQLFWK